MGRPWRHVAILSGFENIREAMRAEWRLKRMGRGRRGSAGVLQGLADVLLHRLFGAGRWTRASETTFSDQALSLWCAPGVEALAPGLRVAVESVGWFFEGDV
jgi:hypothetical protein